MINLHRARTEARRERDRDTAKLHEALDAIQSLILHADCLADEVSTPQARVAIKELQDYAGNLSDVVSTIKAALFDLGTYERVRLVPVVGTVNQGDPS